MSRLGARAKALTDASERGRKFETIVKSFGGTAGGPFFQIFFRRVNTRSLGPLHERNLFRLKII